MSDAWSDLRAHWSKCAAEEPKFGTRDELALMAQCRAIFTGLQMTGGWQPIQYCPKDGTRFLGWEFPSSSPGICYYDGEWPKGSWWMASAGDLWPCRPTLFRLIRPEEQAAIDAYRNREVKP